MGTRRVSECNTDREEEEEEEEKMPYAEHVYRCEAYRDLASGFCVGRLAVYDSNDEL